MTIDARPSALERVFCTLSKGKDEIDVVTSEAEGRLVEIASKEAADAAFPGADPGDDAITAVKLLLQLLNMPIHLCLIDHPVASRSQTNAATGYSAVVTRIPATLLAVPRAATRADTPSVAVCSVDTMKTRPSRRRRSRFSAPSLRRKRPTEL